MNTLPLLALLGGVLIPASTTRTTRAVEATVARVTPGSAETYCTATVNSLGRTASIGSFGSLAPADQTFGLSVTGCPPVASSFGMFTCGTEQTDIPFGNGRLCISPFAQGIFRMTPQSLAQGTVTLSMVTNPQEFLLCTPGSTWNFQFWYRDVAAGGANFNLSDALHVHFAP